MVVDAKLLLMALCPDDELPKPDTETIESFFVIS